MSVLTERMTRSRYVSAAWRAVSGEAFARLKSLAVSMTRRKQVEALGRLDDRMLADIGLTRADVEEAARWSLWGDPTDRLAVAAEERRAMRGGAL